MMIQIGLRLNMQDKVAKSSATTQVVILNYEQRMLLQNFYDMGPTDETVQGVGEMLSKASTDYLRSLQSDDANLKTKEV